MNRRFTIPALVLIALAQLGQSQAPVFKRDLLAGSWKVNWEKSKGPGGAPAAQLPGIYRQYDDQGDGVMLHTMIMVDAAQKHTQTLVAVVKYDGKEYPTYAG